MNNRVKQMFSEQTTTELLEELKSVKDKLTSVEEENKVLRAENNSLHPLNKAQKTRISFLELRLKQRFERTINYYKQMQPVFRNQRDKIHQIFLELPSSMGLFYKQIIQEFHTRYPNEDTKDIPRRTREMTVGVGDEEPRLFCQYENRKAKFYLRLKD